MAESMLSGLSPLETFYVKVLQAPKLAQKTNFFRLLATAQKAGLGLREALMSIRKSEKHPGLGMIMDDLIRQLNSGVDLAKAMKSYDYVFGIEEIALIKSAQTMGNLPEVLHDIATELENYQQIRQKISKALTYPTVLILFSIGAVIVLLIFVVPTIVSMFPNRDSLPGITIFMMDASEFVQKARYAMFLGVIGVVVGYNMAYKYVLPFKIFIDKLLITLPVISSTTKTFYMYRFSKLLGQFFAAGVSPVIALKLISDIFQNFFYKQKTMQINKDLVAGFSFSDSMEGSDLFDPILVQIIHVGEDTGNTGEVMETMANFYRNSLYNKIDTLMALIEPMLMAVVAVIVGGIVGAVFLPMADLVNTIG